MDLNYPTLWPAGGPRGHPRVRTVDVKKSSQTGDKTETGRLFGTYAGPYGTTNGLAHPRTSPRHRPARGGTTGRRCRAWRALHMATAHMQSASFYKPSSTLSYNSR